MKISFNADGSLIADLLDLMNLDLAAYLVPLKSTGLTSSIFMSWSMTFTLCLRG